MIWSRFSKITGDYKYLIINSSQECNGSLIAYDKDGKKLGKKKIKFKGIDENGPSYRSGPQKYNDLYYLGAISSFLNQDKIITIDKDLNIRQIEGHEYTDFIVHDSYAYISYTNVGEGTTLKKVSTKDGKVVKETKVKGIILPIVIPYNDEIILIGDIENKEYEDMKITTLSLDNLTVKEEKIIKNMKATNGHALDNDTIYFAPITDNKDNKIKK